MPTYFSTSNNIVILQKINEVSTTQKHELGTIITAADRDSTAYGTGEFIYLKGVDNTVAGSNVLYQSDDFSTKLIVSGDIGPMAVAMASNVSNTFGWYQIKGKAIIKVAAGFADNSNCYLNATAGTLSNTVSSTNYVFGIKGASAIGAVGTGLAEAELERPFITGLSTF